MRKCRSAFLFLEILTAKALQKESGGCGVNLTPWLSCLENIVKQAIKQTLNNRNREAGREVYGYIHRHGKRNTQLVEPGASGLHQALLSGHRHRADRKIAAPGLLRLSAPCVRWIAA